jgi:hypothetical protein
MIVRYNGGRESRVWCTSPDNLVVGKLYKVTNECNMILQTNYALEGVEGEFTSDWFTEEKPVYAGISRQRPILGKPHSYRRISIVKGFAKFIRDNIDSVTDVLEIGIHLYKVTTENATYYIVSGE